jgi:putative transposase
MTVNPSIDPARLLEEQLAQASPDLLRELLQTFVNTLMSAQADVVCGAEYGTVSQDRVNRRNGYRNREFRHPRRHAGAGDPQAAAGIVLSGVAAGAA